MTTTIPWVSQSRSVLEESIFLCSRPFPSKALPKMAVRSVGRLDMSALSQHRICLLLPLSMSSAGSNWGLEDEESTWPLSQFTASFVQPSVSGLSADEGSAYGTSAASYPLYVRSSILDVLLVSESLVSFPTFIVPQPLHRFPIHPVCGCGTGTRHFRRHTIRGAGLLR